MQLIAPIFALGLAATVSATPAKNVKHCKEPSYFTSAFHTRAVNTTIISNAGEPVPGQPGAFGQYAFRVNSNENIICWDITLVGVTGEYQSPAVTATHLHQAPAGSAGPPRIAFPNPQRTGENPMGQEIRRSSGCQQAPFVTGVRANNGTGPDTGSASGFTLRQVEENPSGFFADVHTQQFVAGAVRGQLNPSEREVKAPKYFTSTLQTVATGDQVISAMTQQPVAGASNGKGYYQFKINTDKDILCYDIFLTGNDISTQYTSPAKTATHTHQGAKGANGPPRLAYKNPQKTKNGSAKWARKLSKNKLGKHPRRSQACIKGPFTTGLIDPTTTRDSGSASGFTLSALQDNPSGFFSDVHTVQFTQGAVRGQMFRV